MIMILRPPLFCLLFLPAAMFLAASTASSQSVPVQTGSAEYQGFHLPTTSGSLRYSLSASERASLGYNGQNQTDYSTAISGNLAFITQSVRYPTSLIYSAGYFTGMNSQSGNYFQSLAVTQSINRKYSVFTITDSLSYLPQSPSVGLSGVPGLGDVGANPIPTATLGLLTEVSQISNIASAQYTRRLTASTSLSALGTYSIQRFLGSSGGLESNTYTVGGGVQHRIDARSSLGAQYSFSNSSYTGSTQAIDFQGVVVTYSRSLTRHISISAGAGPQIVDGSAATGNVSLFSYQVNSSLSYVANSGASAGVSFTRGTNAGQGVSYGGESESVAATASDRIGRSLGVSGSFSYSKTSSLGGSLPQIGVLFPSVDSNSFAGSGQANRAIGRSLSVYVSYSLQHQLYQGNSEGISPLNGSVQTVAIGITYSPESIHLGRQ